MPSIAHHLLCFHWRNCAVFRLLAIPCLFLVFPTPLNIANIATLAKLIFAAYSSFLCNFATHSPHCPDGFHLCACLIFHTYRLGMEEDTPCLSANVQLFLRYIGNALVHRQPPQNGHTASGIPQLTRTSQQHPRIIACLLYHVRYNDHAELVCQCFFLQHQGRSSWDVRSLR